MSLVNKMLRDLDARRVGDGERAALPAAVTPLAAHQEARPVLPRLLPAVLGLVALGFSAWYATRNFGPPPAAVAPVQVAPPPAVVPPPAVAAAPVAAKPTVTAEPAIAAVPPVPEPVAPSAMPAPAPVAALPTLRMADALIALPEAKPEPAHKVPVTSPRPAPPALPAVAAVAPAPTSRPPVAESTPRPAAVVAARAAPVAADALIEKQLRQPSAAERAEGGYRRGLAAARQGLAEDAIGIYRAVLADQAEHAAARQALAALLIEARRYDEAEEVLRKGVDIPSARLSSALALARLQVERHQAAAALETLQKHAAAGDRSAEFQGFAAALLNRAGRSAEAVTHYQAATRLAPGEGRWWAGLGIALDAAGKVAEARDAYQKARSLPGLPADLAQHVEQRLR